MSAYFHRAPADESRGLFMPIHHLRKILVRFTPLRPLHLLLAVVLMTVSVLGSWSLLVPTAHAASPLPHIQTNASASLAGTQQQSAHTIFAPQSFQDTSTATAPKAVNVSSSEPFNGLGDLPFYTYARHPINSTGCSCGKKELLVNIANGDLIAHSTDLQIAGTAGLGLNIDGYYNNLSSSSTDHGYGWNFSLGYDVRLNLNDPSTGITLYGSSGYQAYFAYNSNKDNYTDAPGLNATLTQGNGNVYELTFHKTGVQWIFGADNGSHLTEIRDQNSNKITFTYDSSYDVQSITDTQKRTITFKNNTVFGTSHHPQGQVTQITDPLGNSVTYGYDSNGNLTSTTDQSGATTLYTYDSNHFLIAVTDANGNVTQITYDGHRRVHTIVDPFGKVTKFGFDSGGGETIIVDANGNETTYDYDSHLKVTKTIDALGYTRKATYDATGYNIAQSQDSLGKSTAYAYDTISNLIDTTDPNNNQAKLKYEDSNHPYYPTSATDKEGNTITYDYDSQGNLMDVIDELDSQYKIHYSHNGNGTISKITDAAGTITYYGYDSQGNLTSVTPPAPLGTETLAYDGLSRLTSVIDGKGQKTTYSYNNLNKITGITYADGSTLVYQYDADHNVISVTDHTGKTTYTYDALNRVTQKSLPGSVTISYTYDNLGNLTSYTDAGGTVSYTYTADNLVSTVTDPNGAKTTYSYDGDDNNRLSRIKYPNGVTTNFGRDDDNHVTTMVSKNASGTTLLNLAYYYHGDVNQNVTDTNGNKTTYFYDALRRLTKTVTINSSGDQVGQLNYTYDGPGNLLSTAVNGQTQSTFTYNTANELTSSVRSGITNSYTYDANGNMTSGLGLNFNYNAQNQATAIGSDNYSYSGAGQADRVNANGTNFTYGALGLGSATNGNGGTYYTRDPNGKLISERTPAGTYYYLTDKIDSVRVMTDSSGNVQNTYSYDPFGNSVSKNERVANPWQFASGYFDATTELYKFGTRYYSPQIGRWTQQDSMGIKLGDLTSLNRYVYSNDDPVNQVDPSGKDAIDCYLALAAVFFLSAGAVLAILAGLAGAIESGGLTAVAGFEIGAGLFGYAGAIIAGIQGRRSGVCKGIF